MSEMRVRKRLVAPAVLALTVSACGGHAADGRTGAAGGGTGPAALRLTFLEIPRLRVAGYRTSGTYPVIAGRGGDVSRVNAALRSAVTLAERKDARAALAAELRLPRRLRIRLNRYDPGTYSVSPEARWMSASTRVVSALIPVRALPPGGTDGDGWMSMTIRFPSGEAVRLRDLFADPQTGLTALADAVRRRGLAQNKCIRLSVRSPMTGNISLQGFLPTDAHYRFFALTPTGLAVGFPNGQVAFSGCGRVAVTVPYKLLTRYLSRDGRDLIAGVRKPRT